MTNSILEIELKKFIEVITEDLMFKVPSKKDEERKLKVLTGFLPPETAEEAIPAVAVRVLKVDDTMEERDFTVKIYVALFDKDTKTGYESLILVLQRIVDKINESYIIGEYFSINGISGYEVEEEQPYPFWTGEAKIIFKGPKVSYAGHF
ncbi:MAG: hypothetical protein ACRCU6_00165 [Fusobacteriaceae bacterium]